MAAREQQPWARFGLIKSDGIPAPTGPYEVGCVDLMHGDNQGQLLVRLYYPTDPGLAGRQYSYAKWLPNPRYLKAYMDFQQIKGSWWKSGLYRIMIEPRMPALYGAPLHKSQEPRPSPQEPHPPSAESPPTAPAQTGEKNDTEKDKTPSPEATENPDGTGSDAPQTDAGATADATPPQNDSQPGSEPIPQPSFPVIVFCHGLGAMRVTYSAVCADLSSHGYVVASVEHTDQSACAALRRVPKPNSPAGQLRDDWVEYYFRPPDEPEYPLRNRQVLQRSSEARKALDFLHLLNDGGSDSVLVSCMTGEKFDWTQFRGRLQLDTAAVMGHSFGGATTIHALSEDSRFKCGIALDCWMMPVDPALLETELQQPLVFINSWDFQWRENMLAMMKLAVEPNEDGISKCRIMTIRESNHKNQSDVYFVSPKSVIDDISRIDPALAYTVNQEIVNAFLKRNLLNDPEFQQHLPVLDGGEGASEHVLFGTNVNLEEPKEEINGQIDQGSGEEGPAAEIKEGESVAFTKDRNSIAIAKEEEESRVEDQPRETAQPQATGLEEVTVEVHEEALKQDREENAPAEKAEEEKQLTAEDKQEEEELQAEPTAEEQGDTNNEEKDSTIEEQVEEKQPTTETDETDVKEPEKQPATED